MNETDNKSSQFNQAFINAKLNRVKRAKTEEHGHAEKNHERLPPGQTLTKQWPILDLGVRPAIALSDWRLEFSGLVQDPKTFTWEEFMALPQSLVTADMHCVTTWSKYDNGWKGVRLLDILEIVKPLAEATHVIQYGYDGYTTNVPIEDLLKENALIAYEHDGTPLPPEHGGPTRMIIPELYAWKGSKFIKRLDFVAKDSPGFWEVRGYNNHGDPWKEERYS